MSSRRNSLQWTTTRWGHDAWDHRKLVFVVWEDRAACGLGVRVWNLQEPKRERGGSGEMVNLVGEGEPGTSGQGRVRVLLDQLIDVSGG